MPLPGVRSGDGSCGTRIFAPSGKLISFREVSVMASASRFQKGLIPLLAALTLPVMLCGIGQATQDHGVPSGNCFNNSAQCMIAAGNKYIEAIVSQDPSNVPFAPDCKRRENGIDR